MTNKKGWKIKKEELFDYGKYEWLEEYFFETPDKKYAVLVYNPWEIRNGFTVGLLAIFEDAGVPRLIFNPDRKWFIYPNDRSFSYLKKSGCIALKMGVSNPDVKEYAEPFVIFNLSNRSFSFIAFDFTSSYYNLQEVAQNVVTIVEVSSEEIKNRGLDTRAGQVYDLNSLKWHQLESFDIASELYFS